MENELPTQTVRGESYIHFCTQTNDVLKLRKIIEFQNSFQSSWNVLYFFNYIYLKIAAKRSFAICDVSWKPMKVIKN